MVITSARNQRIFPVPATLAQHLSAHQADRAERQRQHPEHPSFYRDNSDTYHRLYDEALRRLGQLDMLPLDKAAAKMNLTPDALIRKAERGGIVLIELEGQQVVPDWVLDSRGRVKQFHNAIAREFASGGQHGFFKFMSYLKFMGEDMLEFRVNNLPKASVRDVFRAAGIKQGFCHVHVRTPMFEAADRARRNPAIMTSFVDALGSAVTCIGGMGNPNEGGLSPEFIRDYIPHNIPNRKRWEREPGI